MFSHHLLKDKVALVTGASRGIGKGIALALAKEGAIVIGTSTTQSGAERLNDFFVAEKVKGYGFVLNVTELSSIDALFATIKERIGNVNILVNNAAITHDNLLMRMKEEEWLTVLETDLTAVYRLSKACIRDMIKARWGRIINIGSVVGATGNPGQANYCAAKAGIIGLSKSIALEVGSRHITVNTISPGFIETDMTKALTEEQKQSIFERIPMQRIGSVEDIAALVIFLASNLAGYITGQTLHVNGGMYMN